MRFKWLEKILPQNRILYKVEEIADKVIARQNIFLEMSDEQLKQRTSEFIEHLSNGNLMDDILIDALGVIREACFRVHHMLAYKCQLIGALVVNQGDFAEMMTGEGKSLTLVLASYVAALYKKGVHIVTVNEYLVERDAQFANEVLSTLGLSCGYVTSTMDKSEKRINYGCDVTYVSNSELGFDYLRDNMEKNMEDKVQRGLFFAIVDEADSILIDEARTPLIIAGSPNTDTTDYISADRFVKTLNENDYILDEESLSINLSDSGVEKAQRYFKVENIYDLEFSDIVHKIINALKANFIFTNGVQYIVRNSVETGNPEIVLVDPFTGRIMEGRSYSSGLHQAIQAKELVEIQPENVTVAMITYQSLFRQYNKLSGVSGTAYTEAEEILETYNMIVVQVPTNKPIIRIDNPDYIFENKKTKWKYVVAEIKKRHRTRQPILIGTASVEDSEILHSLLTKIGIKHNVLNAKNHALEAEIIKNAGQLSAVTIATYMAGRGTDIKLGEGVKELGGLYVIGTERNESRRVDNQLRGRSGRQGDPGESRFFISLQDTIFKRFAGAQFTKATDKFSEDIIDTKFFSNLLSYTQKRIENLNFDTRKALLDYDAIVSSQRELFYKQRDIILISKNLIDIVYRMGIYVVSDIVESHRDEINKDIVLLTPIIDEFNNTVFYEEYLKFDDFESNAIEYVKENIYSKLLVFIKEIYDKQTPELFNNYMKNIILTYMDENWTWFLDKVAKVRDSVNLRSYEQKSPINIFIEDVDLLFRKMVSNIAQKVVTNINSIFSKTMGGFINDNGELILIKKNNSIFNEEMADALNSEEIISQIKDVIKNEDSIPSVPYEQNIRPLNDYLMSEEQKSFIWNLPDLLKFKVDYLMHQKVSEEEFIVKL